MNSELYALIDCKMNHSSFTKNEAISSKIKQKLKRQ